MESVSAMLDELRVAVEEHIDLVAGVVRGVSDDLRVGFRPAVDNFLGFFHAIDWKEPWIIGLLTFHLVLLLTALLFRRHANIQFVLSAFILAGVFLAERINRFLGGHWKEFASQNYFDPHGLFISVLWSGPLLVIMMLIVVNTLITLCILMVKWKRAQLRHRARAARPKRD